MSSELNRKYLEEWRKVKRWSQSKLARSAGINQSIVSRIEKGEQVGRYETAEKIAEALEIKPEQIIDFDPLFGPAKKEPRQQNLKPLAGYSKTAAMSKIAAASLPY